MSDGISDGHKYYDSGNLMADKRGEAVTTTTKPMSEREPINEDAAVALAQSWAGSWGMCWARWGRRRIDERERFPRRGGRDRGGGTR